MLKKHKKNIENKIFNNQKYMKNAYFLINN
ncbi:hypothetical protein Q787_08130 [Ornithobacterium rhinotracheale H06-030791]|nr:hypothetical protein Q785_08320 [Ornithobacterium rhinotracheale ORT-UMN 88]KGB66190.1 hypothetical protein Q787_08130 [Ornithobacterium rhinotracheale H06-030791]